MTLAVDETPFGTRAPRGVDRAILRLTRALPANWLGLRLAMGLRRIVMARLGEGAIDTMLWGARARLYPRGNSCEKNALFNPQFYDVTERDILAAAVHKATAADRPFVFIDIGANVGLYSLFVAARANTHVRVLAVEPQPGIRERLRFNVQCNPGLNIDVVSAAVTDRDGEIDLIIDSRDRGGTHVGLRDGEEQAEKIHVPSRLLSSLLADAGISSIDALKIDIEGAEERALAPFLRDARAEALPGLILLEDRRDDSTVNLGRLLAERGYKLAARSRANMAFQL